MPHVRFRQKDDLYITPPIRVESLAAFPESAPLARSHTIAGAKDRTNRFASYHLRPTSEDIVRNITEYFPSVVVLNESPRIDGSGPNTMDAALSETQSPVTPVFMSKHRISLIRQNTRRVDSVHSRRSSLNGEVSDPIAAETIPPITEESAFRRRVTQHWRTKLEDAGIASGGLFVTVDNSDATERPALEKSIGFEFCQIAEETSMTPSPKTGELTPSLKWTKGKTLGKGAYGEVFLGINGEGENSWLMAVKQVRYERSKNHPKSSPTDFINTNFIGICLISAGVVGYDIQGKTAFIFLEYVDGGSLRSLISEFGILPNDLVRTFTYQVLCGLDYLHMRSIIHRDIKSANILVNHQGVAKIADFGISKKAVASDNTFERGSFNWMAPEVMTKTGTGYGVTADIWSLGCVVFEMLEGEKPWADLEVYQVALKVLKEEQAPELRGSHSEEVTLFLQACFTRDPWKRPRAHELLRSPFTFADLSRVSPDFNYKIWHENAEVKAMEELSDESNGSDDFNF
ncbi:hypothetical protein HDU84_008645 [Entophlyctis sp. JEL0112]|nr:hypothetical protein HDU84_008645 [Entophlyctis sp. JEL0112]